MIDFSPTLLRATEHEIDRVYGKRCANFRPACKTCRVWRRWHEFLDAHYSKQDERPNYSK